MKKSYKRLYIFDIAIILFLVLNFCFFKVLRGYSIVAFNFFLLIVFKLIFGYEKDNHCYTKSVILNMIIYLLIYFLLFYLLGILISFYRPDPISLDSFKNLILPLVLNIILREYFRYQLLTKSEGNRGLIILGTVLLTILFLIDPITVNSFNKFSDIFTFIALYLLPNISVNVMASYLTIKSGYKPCMLFLLVMNLYPSLLPIVPNPSQYLSSVINLVVPFIFLYNFHNFFIVIQDDSDIVINKKLDFVSLLVPTLLVVVMVYFISGYFQYYAIAIVSGSMSPVFNRGDAVIVSKINDRYDEIKKGEIIAFNYDDIIVVHRVVNILNDSGHYVFYTKGDANDNIDNWVVTEDKIIGTVKLKLDYIGVPTVWFNEQFAR